MGGLEPVGVVFQSSTGSTDDAVAELVGWEVGSIGRTNTLVDMVLIEENDLTFAPQLCHVAAQWAQSSSSSKHYPLATDAV